MGNTHTHTPVPPHVRPLAEEYQCASSHHNPLKCSSSGLSRPAGSENWNESVLPSHCGCRQINEVFTNYHLAQ